MYIYIYTYIHLNIHKYSFDVASWPKTILVRIDIRPQTKNKKLHTSSGVSCVALDGREASSSFTRWLIFDLQYSACVRVRACVCGNRCHQASIWMPVHVCEHVHNAYVGSWILCAWLSLEYVLVVSKYTCCSHHTRTPAGAPDARGPACPSKMPYKFNWLLPWILGASMTRSSFACRRPRVEQNPNPSTGWASGASPVYGCVSKDNCTKLHHSLEWDSASVSSKVCVCLANRRMVLVLLLCLAWNLREHVVAQIRLPRTCRNACAGYGRAWLRAWIHTRHGWAHALKCVSTHLLAIALWLWATGYTNNSHSCLQYPEQCWAHH